MAEPQIADLYVLVEILGHDADCHAHVHRECEDWCDDTCTKDFALCTVWRTASGLLSSDNLNRLLSKAWRSGFQACQSRIGRDLLSLLPRAVDAGDPYGIGRGATEGSET